MSFMVKIEDFKNWFTHSETNNSPALKLNIPSDPLIQSFLNVSQSIILDMLAISELEPKKSIGILEIKRSDPSDRTVIDIPVGTQFTANGKVFVSSELASISQSSLMVEIAVSSQKTGSDKNLPAGTVFTTSINGVTVRNPNALTQGVSAYDSLPNNDRVTQAVYILCLFYIENRSSQEVVDHISIDENIDSRKTSYYRARIYPAVLKQIVSMIGKYRNHKSFIPVKNEAMTT